MIVWIWVFFMVGDPTPEEPGTAYTQVTASPWDHQMHPESVELECQQEFHAKYPGHCVCDSGWVQQQVRVLGQ